MINVGLVSYHVVSSRVQEELSLAALRMLHLDEALGPQLLLDIGELGWAACTYAFFRLHECFSEILNQHDAIAIVAIHTRAPLRGRFFKTQIPKPWNRFLSRV